MEEKIPLNRPHMTGKELSYIEDAHKQGRLAGDGIYTKRCSSRLETQTGSARVLLTHSCTAALEMQAILFNIGQGDEVIMPSFTFVSTANAVVLRGGRPVFVDIRDDTLNIDERLIEAAITPRTKAIIPVHYAGVGCAMDEIMDIANTHNLWVAEDAAQGYLSSYKGRMLGTIGHLGAYSFHETKNIISGEGGAILVNDPQFVEQAEIIREKGTDRSQFFRGEIDKYTWQAAGSSYLPGELISAFLFAQLEEAEAITARRLSLWKYYHEQLEELERKGYLRRPVIPKECGHNGHMYYLLLNSAADRARILQIFREAGIYATFHYVPLHSASAGKRFARVAGKMRHTDELSARLVRLPLYFDLTQTQQDKICDILFSAFS